MEKKYQVFVSSTYEDLQEERKKVMDALLQMNCFPVGMEYFNASDSSQWDVIKNLIEECDYYVLIVAGRYGSVEESSGKSYTQKEFEYAVEKGIPVISFVHKDPSSLPESKNESEPDKKKKLDDFINNEIKKKFCKFWENADGLALQVVLALTKKINIPHIKPVKADNISFADANRENLAIDKELSVFFKKEEAKEKQRIDEQHIEIWHMFLGLTPRPLGNIVNVFKDGVKDPGNKYIRIITIPEFDKIQKYQNVLHVVGNPIDSFTLNFDPYFYKLIERYIQTGKKEQVDYKEE